MPTPHQLNYQKVLGEAETRKNTNRKEESSELVVGFLRRRLVDEVEIKKEFRFHPTRLWRIDVAVPDLKIGIEIQGGNFGGPGIVCDKCGKPVHRRLANGRVIRVIDNGRHANATRLRGEYEKLSSAASLGWKMFLFMPEQIRNGLAYQLLEPALSRR